ncbi:hypothetical protein NECAME_02885 [Necator americanus]|uniref:C6 domain-containing protein n=1 Tax=Necator americanus TaxID=51031 RepID=W2T9A6_NECAM|nr:hypothetical protein NECAME_02885 [Necator americanus]ETN78448.1 hypothetical protein NECAME_02885 [Necator americanus]
MRHMHCGSCGLPSGLRTLPNNAQGCKQINAVCESGSSTATSFMEFNKGVGGPSTAPTVKTLLVCNTDQKWYYSDGANSLAITDVTCTTNDSGGPSEKPCASCDESAVLFGSKSMPDEVNVVKQ